jgi:hypothetical protein
MLVVVRLLPDRGGDPNNSIFINVLHDTGSSVFSVQDKDIRALMRNLPNGPGSYQGWLPNVRIHTANGEVYRRSLLVEHAVLDSTTQSFLTPWIREVACVFPPELVASTRRLSGFAFRRYLYVGHVPMSVNQNLYMAPSRQQYVSQLPDMPPNYGPDSYP